MQSGVESREMSCKPVGQTLFQPPCTTGRIDKIIIHQVSEPVEQDFMIVFVRLKLS